MLLFLLCIVLSKTFPFRHHVYIAWYCKTRILRVLYVIVEPIWKTSSDHVYYLIKKQGQLPHWDYLDNNIILRGGGVVVC